MDAKEVKGEILEISKVEGVVYDHKRIKIKGKDGELVFKWDKGNVKMIEDAIGGTLKVDITQSKKGKKTGATSRLKDSSRSRGFTNGTPPPTTLTTTITTPPTELPTTELPTTSPPNTPTFSSRSFVATTPPTTPTSTNNSATIHTPPTSPSLTGTATPPTTPPSLRAKDGLTTTSYNNTTNGTDSSSSCSLSYSPSCSFDDLDDADLRPQNLSKARRLFGTKGDFGFTDEDLEKLTENGCTENIPAGEIILEAGSMTHELIVVLAGDYTAVLERTEGGRGKEKVKLNNVFIGEISFVLDCPSTASIFAGDKGCSLIRVAYSTIILLSRLDSLFLCRLYQSFLIQLWKRLQSHDTQKTGKLMTRDTSEKSVKMEIKRSGDSLARTSQKRGHVSEVPSLRSSMGAATGESFTIMANSDSFVSFLCEKESPRKDEEKKKKKASSRLSQMVSKHEPERASETVISTTQENRERPRAGSAEEISKRDKRDKKTKEKHNKEKERGGKRVTRGGGGSVGGVGGMGGGEGKEARRASTMGEDNDFLNSFVDPMGDLTRGAFVGGKQRSQTCRSPGRNHSLNLERNAQFKSDLDISTAEISDPLFCFSHSTGNAAAAGFMEYVDEELKSNEDIQHSVVIGFQLEEMLYATKLTELRQWRDHCLKLNNFHVLDDLCEIHSNLVEACCTYSIPKIVEAFKTIQWRVAYVSYFAIYPTLIKKISQIPLTVLEKDSVLTLISLPLKRLSDYATFFSNLYVNIVKKREGGEREEGEEEGEGGVSRKELQDRLGEVRLAMGECQQVMFVSYIE